MKAIIPAAGLGTRMLPFTKEQPKEMLPVYYTSDSGEDGIKPIVQLIFEHLYDSNIREFCFIVGRTKRSVEDHFTPDYQFLEMLTKNEKDSQFKDLKHFYKKINESAIFWINQPEPKGFGHAVLLAEPFVGNSDFLVHAGDAYIFSTNGKPPIQRMLELHNKTGADAILLVNKISDVEQLKHHGVIVPEKSNEVISVKGIVEKPEKPASDLAVMPIYIFRPTIFKALRDTKPDFRGEIQLTDAIGRLITEGSKVLAIEMGYQDIRIDVGMPETYKKSLDILFYKHGHEQTTQR
ncbi:MAG: UTP--glucose-1-phosphate uridylyltransferase [Nitrososphaerales archaeon]